MEEQHCGEAWEKKVISEGCVEFLVQTWHEGGLCLLVYLKFVTLKFVDLFCLSFSVERKNRWYNTGRKLLNKDEYRHYV